MTTPVDSDRAHNSADILENLYVDISYFYHHFIGLYAKLQRKHYVIAEDSEIS